MVVKSISPGRGNQIREGSRVVDAILIVIAILIVAVTLYPLYYVFIMSVSDPNSVLAMDVFLYPKGFQLETYAMLFGDNAMWRSYANTVFYVAATTISTLVTSVLGAYPLIVKDLRGRKLLITFLLIPMYFGGGLIPTYLLMTKMSLYNNYAAMIVPSMVSIWYIILVRTNFASIPEELSESAIIDGARHIQILFRIFVPISRPIMAVIAIYSIVGVWNSWFNAMVYLPNADLHPLQLYLQRVLVQQSVDLTKLNSVELEGAVKKMYTATQLKYAIIIFTTLPIIFTYPFFQKYFVKGVMLGSLKG